MTARVISEENKFKHVSDLDKNGLEWLFPQLNEIKFAVNSYEGIKFTGTEFKNESNNFENKLKLTLGK